MRGRYFKYVFPLFNIILSGSGIYSMYTAVNIVSKIEAYSEIIGKKYGLIIDIIIVVTGFLFLLSILEITCYRNAHFCNLITTGEYLFLSFLSN